MMVRGHHVHAQGTYPERHRHNASEYEHERRVYWSTDRPRTGASDHHQAQEDRIDFRGGVVAVWGSLGQVSGTGPAPVLRRSCTWEPGYILIGLHIIEFSKMWVTWYMDTHKNIGFGGPWGRYRELVRHRFDEGPAPGNLVIY